MSDLVRPVQAAPAPREAYLEWEEGAACASASVDPDIFFPEKGGSYAEASKVCRKCPVLDRCRSWNDRVEGDTWVAGIFGMYANETPLERTARRRQERSVA